MNSDLLQKLFCIIFVIFVLYSSLMLLISEESQLHVDVLHVWMCCCVVRVEEGCRSKEGSRVKLPPFLPVKGVSAGRKNT